MINMWLHHLEVRMKVVLFVLVTLFTTNAFALRTEVGSYCYDDSSESIWKREGGGLAIYECTNGRVSKRYHKGTETSQVDEGPSSSVGLEALE